MSYVSKGLVEGSNGFFCPQGSHSSPATKFPDFFLFCISAKSRFHLLFASWKYDVYGYWINYVKSPVIVSTLSLLPPSLPLTLWNLFVHSITFTITIMDITLNRTVGKKGMLAAVGHNSWWHVKCVQHAARNPKCRNEKYSHIPGAGTSKD